jgi:NADPH:quinone reductase-like Zn-dependent oxidoreductase
LKYQRIIITEFGGPDVLTLVEEPNLPEPQNGEVRVKVLAASASFTDVWIRKETYPHLKSKPPFSPGYDCVGVVDALGEGVTTLKVGQRVAALTMTGSYAEYICLTEDSLTLVPNDVDPAEAVCCILSYLTAYQMLHRVARIKYGQRILVHGAAGAVGSALIQLGKLYDLEMYGTASASKQDVVQRLGAFPIDYRNADFVQVIREHTPSGVDAAFDAVGWENFKRSFKSLQRKGKLVAYGFYNTSLGRQGTIALDYIRLQLLNLSFDGRTAAFYDILPLRAKKPHWFSEDVGNLFKLLHDKKIQPVIAQRLSLSEAQYAHERIENADVEGKIVFVMNG